MQSTHLEVHGFVPLSRLFVLLLQLFNPLRPLCKFSQCRLILILVLVTVDLDLVELVRTFPVI